MKYVILAFALLSGSAFANTNCVDAIMASSISAEQKAKLVQECAPVTTPEQTFIDNVANVGTETLEQASEISVTVAQTIKMVAKELNVAANEFVETPVGKIVAVLVVLHFAGDYAQHTLAFIWDVVMGIFIMLIGWIVCRQVRKFALTGTPVEVKYTNIFGKECTKMVKKPLSFNSMKQEIEDSDTIDTIFIAVVISYILQVLSVIVGLNFMVPG